MATPVIMPRQGQSVESCIISKWHKKVGDMVAEGDMLFSYETDKASFDEVSKLCIEEQEMLGYNWNYPPFDFDVNDISNTNAFMLIYNNIEDVLIIPDCRLSEAGVSATAEWARFQFFHHSALLTFWDDSLSCFEIFKE